VIDAPAIQSLPLVDRNVYTLLDLTPGVQSNNNGVATASVTTSSLKPRVPRAAHADQRRRRRRHGSVNYYLDGGINMTGCATPAISCEPRRHPGVQGPDNSYNAEYGRFSSGIIKRHHEVRHQTVPGLGIEYVRDGKFNAQDWGSAIEAPPFKRNQYGGTVGGPIKTDRTFFFATYSGLRQTTQTFLNTAIVPTALERAGDFSQSKTMPTDPATGTTFTCNGVVGVVCANRLDPVSMKIINTYIPQANMPGNIWQGTWRAPTTRTSS